MEPKPPKGAGISPDFYTTLGLSLETRQGIAYASVEQMIKKYCPQAKTALDYGCGTGRSTQLLRQIGIEQVIGVDINTEMLETAQKQKTPGISYALIDSGTLPFKDNTFDLAFCGLVFLEIPKANEIQKVLTELKRVTAPSGVAMILTCTKEGYTTDSDSFECLLTQKQTDGLKDGDPVPTRVKSTGQEFTDYFWSDDFLRSAITQTGLKIEEVNVPDKQHYVIYVCKK